MRIFGAYGLGRTRSHRGLGNPNKETVGRGEAGERDKAGMTRVTGDLKVVTAAEGGEGHQGWVVSE